MSNLLIPDKNCQKCKRLVDFRNSNRKLYTDWHNSPVPSFGGINSILLIVGLAPGLKGANRTGRPFTGDYAGDLLYPTLIKFGWAMGEYNKSFYNNLNLINCRITNAVRCVPPKNKPESIEQNNCFSFLNNEIHNLPKLKYIIALGTIAHKAVIKCFKLKLRDYKFCHGKEFILPNSIGLIDSYHCSRYNINTGRLTKKMFEKIFLKLPR